MIYNVFFPNNFSELVKSFEESVINESDCFSFFGSCIQMAVKNNKKNLGYEMMEIKGKDMTKYMGKQFIWYC